MMNSDERSSRTSPLRIGWGILLYFLVLGIVTAWLVDQQQVRMQRDRLEWASDLEDVMSTKFWRALRGEALEWDRFVLDPLERPEKLRASRLVKACWELDEQPPVLRWITASGTGTLPLTDAHAWRDALETVFGGSCATPVAGLDVLVPKDGERAREADLFHLGGDPNRDLVCVTRRLASASGSVRGVLYARDEWLSRLIAPVLSETADRLGLILDLYNPVSERIFRSDFQSPVPEERRQPYAGAPKQMLPLRGYFLRTAIDTMRATWFSQPWAFLILGMSLAITVLAAFTGWTLHQRARLQEREWRLRNDWIANLAHVLRGPLHTLGVLVEGLPDLPEADRARRCQLIQGEITGLDRTSRRFIRLSRADLAGRESHAQPVAVMPVVRVVIERLRVRFPQIGEASFLITGDDGLAAATDPDGFSETCEAILENAMKYSPRDPRIEVELRREGGGLVLEVRDRGLGIPRELLPKLGQPFFRGQQTHADGIVGTGLGLYLAMRQCRAFGGELRIDSPGEGLGTTVRMTLPAA